jgi:hypothetical protein
MTYKRESVLSIIIIKKFTYSMKLTSLLIIASLLALTINAGTLKQRLSRNNLVEVDSEL